MRKHRLDWAKAHQGWTVDQWKSVVFSDESKFNLRGSNGQYTVRRRKGEEYHPDCIQHTIKHSVSQMVWGRISDQGVSGLHFVQGTVNTQVYITTNPLNDLPKRADSDYLTCTLTLLL